MEELYNLSIIIVTWKGDELLRNCLASLAAACGTLPEIVVVDNAKENSTHEIVRRFQNVTYVATEDNLGFAGGNNVGLRHCHREFVVLLNNDTVVHDEPFTSLICYLKDHPKVAVVQGTMTMPLCGGLPDACGANLTHDGFPVPRLYQSMDNPNVITVAAVYSAKGALMAFRRDLPGKIGGLFHDFYRNVHEEFDFCARSWLAGYEVHYIPTPIVEHLCSRTLTRLDCSEMLQQSYCNNLCMLLTVLSPSYAFRVIFRWMCWRMTHAILVLIRQGNARHIRIVLTAVGRAWKMRSHIWKIRRCVQSFRAVSDAEIFRRVVVRKPLDYYWSELRGNRQPFDV